MSENLKYDMDTMKLVHVTGKLINIPGASFDLQYGTGHDSIELFVPGIDSMKEGGRLYFDASYLAELVAALNEIVAIRQKLQEDHQ